MPAQYENFQNSSTFSEKTFRLEAIINTFTVNTLGVTRQGFLSFASLEGSLTGSRELHYNDGCPIVNGSMTR